MRSVYEIKQQTHTLFRTSADKKDGAYSDQDVECVATLRDLLPYHWSDIIDAWTY